MNKVCVCQNPIMYHLMMMMPLLPEAQSRVDVLRRWMDFRTEFQPDVKCAKPSDVLLSAAHVLRLESLFFQE